MSRTSLVSLLFCVACGGSEPALVAPVSPTKEAPPVEEAPPEPAQPATFDLDNPASCEPCHATIVAEWRTSMHAKAHQDNDPLFAAMLALRMKREGDDLPGKCATCHSPRSPADLDTVAAKAGVSCATCHTAASIDLSTRGVMALVAGKEGVVYGPHDIEAGASPVHGTAASPAHMKADSNDLCFACHKQLANPAGVPVCTTGAEHAEAGAASCRSCHMPRVEGPAGAVGGRADHANHGFLGPRQQLDGVESTILADAIGLSGSLEGGTLTVSLANQSGHAVPTGFPGRMVIVKAVGKDTSGQVAWQNWESDPMGESPDSVLVRLFGDAEGKPTMPPYSTQELKDARLKPGETRTVTFADVPEAVAEVELSLLYRPAPPALLEKVGLTDSPFAQPREMLTAKVTR